MKTLFGILWLCAASAVIHAQYYGPIYVRHNATGVQNGTSWANAFRSLQNAIDAAPPGGQIWIAAGVYKPERDSTGNPTPTDMRTRTFFINKQIQLYGGFTGTEQSIEQRDFSANSTILSGDLGVQGVHTDNAYHVVHLERAGALCILDGLTITQGNANGTSGNTGNGGGIFLQHAPPQYSTLTLRNCLIKENNATYGGGLSSQSTNWSGAPIRIERCQFRNNTASSGGGIYWRHNNYSFTTLELTEVVFIGQNIQYHGGGMDVSGRFTAQNCRFEENRAGRGAGINMQGGAGVLESCTFMHNTSRLNGGGMRAEASSVTAINCLFLGNEANLANEFFTTINAGGGFFYRGSGSTSAKLINCVFSGNKGQNGAGFAITTTILNYSVAELDNCSFAGNNGLSAVVRLQGDLGVDNSIIYGNNGTALSGGAARYCIIEGGYTGIGNINNDPLFVSLPNYAVAPTAAGNLQLQPGSPAINQGRDSLASLHVVRDAGNNHRVAGCTIDIGAFEYGSPGPNDIICYADNDGDGAGNPAAPRLACNTCPTGFVSNHNDCNDNAPHITNILPAPSALKLTAHFCRGEPDATVRSISAQAPDRLVWVLVQAPAGSRFATSLPRSFLPGEVNTEFSIRKDTLTLNSEPTYLDLPVNGLWVFEVYYETENGCRSLKRQGFSVQAGHEPADGRIQASNSRVCAGQPVVLSFQALAGQGPFDIVVNGRTYTGLSHDANFDTLIAGVHFSDSLVLRLERVTNATQCPGTTGILQTFIIFNTGVPTTSSLTVQTCGSYTINGQTYTQSGIYTQTMTNSAGCDSSVVLHLTIDQPPIVEINIQHPTCPNSANGRAEVIVSQGTTPSSYLWSNGQTTATTTGLLPGTYSLTLTTPNGCSSNQSITLQPQYTMNISITILQTVACHGDHTGAVTVSPIGGVGPYQFQWAHGPQTATLTGLPAGVYQISITDAGGCLATGAVVFIPPQELNTRVSQNGTTLTAEQSNVSYQWIDCTTGQPIPGAVQQAFTPAQNGHYAVVLTQDACRDTSECVLVTVTHLLDDNSPWSLAEVFPNPNNGQFTLRLPWPAEVTLHDLSGKILNRYRFAPGEHPISLDAPAGIYLLRLANTRRGVQTLRIITTRL